MPCILSTMFKRYLDKNLPNETFFLFGPRQVGKTTLLKRLKTIFSIDLLDPDSQLLYSKDPNLLARQIEALPKQGVALVDEIQKVPALLDVIQSLIEKYPKLKFALSGSSARKLRHGHANLLGGRALYHTMHPLTLDELGKHFSLDTVLRYGSLPKIWECLLSQKEELAQEFLRSYITTYLREEIKAEALVRNLQGFQNFLDVAAAQFAEQVNFSDMGRQCSVAYSTVREFYSILEDTLIGFFLYPCFKSERKRMSHSPKFFFFDNGVTRAILGGLKSAPTSLEKGRLFEQWVIQETQRINLYEAKDWRLSFWRTSHGAEVDLVAERGKEILFAAEIKHKRAISSADLHGLHSFREAHPNIPCYVVTPSTVAQKIGTNLVLSSTEFFNAIRQLP
ncbi:MAG: AAA family ATPase [Candidatus Margulisbacteria bacterium]|nr:AAA family ATPase [Candidatus Margulisiibacteriota bacterium]